MPLLDHFRFPRLGRSVPPPQVAVAPIEPTSRLDRVVSRSVRVASEIEQKLDAMESEYSAPLYGPSAYGSPETDEVEDGSWTA